MFDKVANKMIIDGELYDKIRTDESTWTIEDNRTLNFQFYKYEEGIWNTVIKGDEEIDPKEVDNSKKIEEFDEET